MISSCGNIATVRFEQCGHIRVFKMVQPCTLGSLVGEVDVGCRNHGWDGQVGRATAEHRREVIRVDDNAFHERSDEAGAVDQLSDIPRP